MTTTPTAAPLEITLQGNILPANTADVCCVCGKHIPESDYRMGGLHDGIIYMQGGSTRYVQRSAHMACRTTDASKLLW